MSSEAERWVPLAALAVLATPDPAEEADLPIAYIPREVANATTYREVLERAVNWGRR
ncbi:MAG TPA: hypothetical protein VN864_05640 [Thermoplasmata archaeon]|nr:hypothetical protein [Thermoplasmata archaeon]